MHRVVRLLALLALAPSGCALINGLTGEPELVLFTSRVDHDVPGVLAIAMADVSGDGVLDVVLTRDALTLSAIVSGAPMQLMTGLPFAPDVIAVADLDRDGTPDLVGSGGTQLMIVHDLRGRRELTSFEINTDFFVGGADLAVSDLDSDQRPDIVLAARADDPMIFFQLAGGDFSPTPVVIDTDASFSNPSNRVGITDADADGLDDLLLLQPGAFPERVALVHQSSPRQFAAPQTLLASEGFNTLEELLVADLDGVGRAEVGAIFDDHVEIQRASGDPVQLGPFGGSPLGDRAAAADIIGDDGLLELVVAHSFQDQVIVFRQRRALQFDTGLLFALPGDPKDVAAGDVDGDGRADVAVLSVSAVSIFLTRCATVTREPLIGRTLGSYRILDKIGQGGMGAVYLAEHTVIGRKVAIKVLLPEVSLDPSRTRRFFNEARASAQIRHSGIVDVLDFGTDTTGQAYLVMEYLDGESLSARLRRAGTLPEATARRYARQMASALAAAHAHQIIHRDLKPDNLFIVPDENAVGGERIKVLDFGIAKLLGEPEGSGAVETRSGALIGSPGYMAPEQARGAGTIDERTDVYALGCVLFEMLCGRRPFVAAGYGEVLSMHMHDPAPSPRAFAPAISGALEGLVLRMLAKSPADRPSSMEALAQTLDQLSGTTPDPGVAAAVLREHASAPTLPPTRVGAGVVIGATQTSSQLSDRDEAPAAKATITTMGHSAAEVTAPPPPRRSRILGLLAVAALVAAVAAGVTWPWRTEPVAPVVVPDAAPPPPPDAAASPPDAAPPSPPDATPPPSPDAAPRRPRAHPASRPELKRGELIDE